MSVSIIFDALVSTLEANGFAGRVFRFDPQSIERPGIASALVLKFEGMAAEVTTYADASWQRTWQFSCKIFSQYTADAVASHARLLTTINDLVTAITSNPDLGTNLTIEATVVSINEVEPEVSEQGTIGQLSALATIQVVEYL